MVKGPSLVAAKPVKGGIVLGSAFTYFLGVSTWRIQVLENTVDFDFLGECLHFHLHLIANNTRSHHPVTSSELWRSSSSASFSRVGWQTCGRLCLGLVFVPTLVEFSGTWKLYTAFDFLWNGNW